MKTDCLKSGGRVVLLLLTICCVLLCPEARALSIAHDDRFVVDPDSNANVLDVRANDWDPGLVFISSFTQPSDGTLEVNPSGAFLFAPTPGFRGLTHFTYTLSIDERKITANPVAEHGYFGRSIAMSGDTAVVGSPAEAAGGWWVGVVYVLGRSGSDWSLVKKLQLATPVDNASFGLSVAISADTIAVGAPGDTGAYWPNGSIYIYQRNAGGVNNWGLVKKAFPSSDNNPRAFGSSLAINGDTIVAGDPRLSGSPGSAYIFRRNQGGSNAWGQVVRLDSDNPQNDDKFGEAVGVAGDTVFVGSPGDKTRGVDFGAVFVFQQNQGGTDHWGRVKKFPGPQGTTTSGLGNSISVSGNEVAAGSGWNENNVWSGIVFILARDVEGPNQWGQLAMVKPSLVEPLSGFGRAVCLRGDQLLVGAPIGKAYLFERDSGGTNKWGQAAQLMPSDPAVYQEYGSSVAFDSGYAMIGAPNDYSVVDRGGAVYARDLLATTGNLFSIATVTVDVNIYNHAPVFRFPGDTLCAMNERTHLSGFNVSDPDLFRNPAAELEVRCGVSRGTLRATDLTSLTTVSGVDSSTMTLKGQVNALNNALRTLSYLPPSDYVGAAMLRVKADDLGNLGLPGPLTSQTATVLVIPTPPPKAVDDILSMNPRSGIVRLKPLKNDLWTIPSVYTDVLTPPAHASIKVDKTEGFILFQPDAGFVGVTSFTYGLTIREERKWAADGGQTKGLGDAVAICGDFAIVGAPTHDECGSRAGAAYLFQRTQYGWWQVKRVLPDHSFYPGVLFGGSVAISGETAAVATLNCDEVYVYERNHGGPDNWGCVKRLGLTSGTPWVDTDRWTQVSISGDTLVVGDHYDEDAGHYSGAVYIYERNQRGPNQWGQTCKLKPADLGKGYCFGHSVCVDGDVLAVGAPWVGENYNGAVYIFRRDKGGADMWGQVAKLFPSTPSPDMWFGLVVAVKGNALAVGTKQKKVYVFERNSPEMDDWSQVAELTPSDGVEYTRFGQALSICGDTLAVGAYGYESMGTLGSVHLFKRNEGGPAAWGRTSKIQGADITNTYLFGLAVAVCDDILLVGSYPSGPYGQWYGGFSVFDLRQTNTAVVQVTVDPNYLPSASVRDSWTLFR